MPAMIAGTSGQPATRRSKAASCSPAASLAMPSSLCASASTAPASSMSRARTLLVPQSTAISAPAASVVRHGPAMSRKHHVSRQDGAGPVDARMTSSTGHSSWIVSAARPARRSISISATRVPAARIGERSRRQRRHHAVGIEEREDVVMGDQRHVPAERQAGGADDAQAAEAPASSTRPGRRSGAAPSARKRSARRKPTSSVIAPVADQALVGRQPALGEAPRGSRARDAPRR